MAIVDKRLLHFVAVFCIILASTHAAESRSLQSTSSNPLSKLSNRLNQLNWDPVRINSATRQYWNTKNSFLAYKVDSQGKRTTTLTTSCHLTSPWLVVGLLQQQTRSYWYPDAYFVPRNKNLVIFNNAPKPYDKSAKSAVQSIRNFIASRPSSESIVIQVDLLEDIKLPPNRYSDHHLMIHSHNGKINLYQAWLHGFTLIDWMSGSGSFNSRYPMNRDTFLYHLETALTPATTTANRIKREESQWAIFGRTRTKNWITSNGRRIINDLVVRGMRNKWDVVLVTHWPNRT